VRNLHNVFYVRDKADADAMMTALAGGARRAVVIGGGYIGLEAAAVLRKLGCAVTLVEMLPRLLARVAGEELSTFYAEEHRRQGVDVRLSCGVTEILGDAGGKASGVVLDNGTSLACDMVVVGIGIVPAVGAPDRSRSSGIERGGCRFLLPHHAG
jgi:3-phenylpropionate/trans-cinnamate dioxygenase ferredoxin reductase component